MLTYNSRLTRVTYSSDVSRNSEISLQCYLRTEEPKRGGDGIADDMGNDIYMGGVRFTPDFDDMGAPQEQWYELSGGSGKGKVMIALAYQPSTVSFAFTYCAVLLAVLDPEDNRIAFHAADTKLCRVP